MSSGIALIPSSLPLAAATMPPTAAKALAVRTRLRQTQRLAALGTLSAGIAHDFNNILSMLRGYLSLARASLGPQHPAQADLAEVENGAARAAALARRILSFSRPQEQVLQPMRIDAAARESLNLLRATLPGRIDILSDFSPSLPPIRGDSIQIQQVLINLCINAAQAIPDGGGVIRMFIEPVQVKGAPAARAAAATSPGVSPRARPGLPALPAGDYVRVSVRDTGCGMDAATRKRIFDPFFTTKPREIGTGLGLSVVREIVTEHNGMITVWSKPGKGTEFNLFFPAAQPNLSAESAPQRLGRGQRILFLDDDVGFVELVQRVLGKAGYRVIGHTSPARALAEFTASPAQFDLIVADLSMSDANGIDVAQHMTAVRSDIPIIITTGCISPEDRARADACGVREVIDKSATVEELCKAFGRALRGNA